MNEHELERFEAELQRTRPAHPPGQFMAMLKAAKPRMEAAQAPERPAEAPVPGWWQVWRWLTPALAVALAGAVIVREQFKPAGIVKKPQLAATYGFKGDNVQLDQELISSFDVVAKLPGGEPVRFHCRKWNDQLLVKDTRGGVEIEQNSPRVEVVPVRFETY